MLFYKAWIVCFCGRVCVPRATRRPATAAGLLVPLGSLSFKFKVINSPKGTVELMPWIGVRTDQIARHGAWLGDVERSLTTKDSEGRPASEAVIASARSCSPRRERLPTEEH